MNKRKVGLILILVSSIALFIAEYGVNFLSSSLRVLLYFGGVCIGIAGLYLFTDSFNLSVNARQRFKVIGRYLFGAALAFIPSAMYYFMWRDGISSLYYPVFYIVSAIGLSLSFFIYSYFFLYKPTKK